jgi:hypothetical protein
MTPNDQSRSSTKVSRPLSASLSEQLQVPFWLLRHISLCRVAFGGSLRPIEVQIEELQTALVTIEAQEHPECTVTLLRAILSLLELKKIDERLKSRSVRGVRSQCMSPELQLQEIQLRSTVQGCLHEHANKRWYPKTGS